MLDLATGVYTISEGVHERRRGREKRQKALDIHGAIPDVDPDVARHYRELRERRDWADRGLSPITQWQKGAIRESGLQRDANLRRVAGTSPGSAAQSLLRSGALTNRALGQVGAEASRESMQYSAMLPPLVSDIADRRLSLTQWMRDLMLMEGAQHEQNGANMVWGGIAQTKGAVGGLAGGMGGGMGGGMMGGAKTGASGGGAAAGGGGGAIGSGLSDSFGLPMVW